MKILQLASSYPADDADATAPFVRSMAHALADLGHSVMVFAPEHPKSGGLPARYSSAAGGDVTVEWIRYAPVASLNVIGNGRSLKGDRRLDPRVLVALPPYVVVSLLRGLRVIQSWKPDIIQAHWVVVPGFVGAVLSKVTNTPMIVNLHGSDIFMAAKSRTIGTFARYAFSRAKGVSACSPNLAEGATALGATNVRMIPHGADPFLFPTKPDYNEIPVILSVGRSVAKKGLDVLLSQAGHLLQSHVTAQIWIAGDGSERERLEGLCGGLEPSVRSRVKFLGAVSWPDVGALMRRASIFVVPSVQDASGNEDGLPTAILEAMASGLPIVASDIAGVSLVVKHGVNGLLVAPGDGVGLSAAVTTLLSEPAMREKMGVAGRGLVESQFSWAHSARSHEEMIRDAIGA